MKIKIVLLLVLCGAWCKGYSQGAEVMYPSASSMGLVARVNHTTGHVNVSVPLMALQYHGIKIPIALGYNTSGIRVEERPAEVGYGWQLSAGGKITRVVRRRPDVISRDTQLWNSDSMEVALAFYGTIASMYKYYNEVDSEPDLFYYEIPGKAGMFVLDGRGVPQTIPYDAGIRISVKYRDQVQAESDVYFEIRDNAGAVYTFGNSSASQERTTLTFENDNENHFNIAVDADGKEIVKPADWPFMWPWPIVYEDSFSPAPSRPDGWKNHWPWPVTRFDDRPFDWPSSWSWPIAGVRKFLNTETLNYISTWHLDKIKDYRGNVATLTYIDGNNEEITSTANWISLTPVPNGEARFERSSGDSETRTQTSVKLISAITAGSHRVDFSLSDNLLKRIVYSADSSPVQNYAFQYQTFEHGRPFLDKITMGLERMCSFEYDRSRSLPPHNSYDYDSWGYYNGKSNSSNVPTIPEGYDASRVHEVPGADRSPSLLHTKAGILTTIVHNTGGKTIYEYGLNVHDGVGYIGGLRVDRIGNVDENGEEVGSTRYEYGRSMLGGHGVYPSHLGSYRKEGIDLIINGYHYSGYWPIVSSSRPLNDLASVSGAHIMYGEIAEIAPDGSKTIYEYTTGNDGEYFSNKQGLTLQYLGDYLAIIGNNANFVPRGKGAPTSRFWRQGLLKRERKIDSKGNTIQDVKYTYKNMPNRSSIKAYTPATSSLNFPGMGMFKFLFSYEWESQPVLLESVETWSYNAPATTTRYEYDDEFMAPVSVTQTSAGNSTKTTYYYAHTHVYTRAGEEPGAHLEDAGVLAPVETVTLRNDKVVGSEYVAYNHTPLAENPDAVLPARKYYLPLLAPAAPLDYYSVGQYSGYKIAEEYRYDDRGNVVCISTPQGRATSFIYLKDSNGNNTELRIAEISNATRDEVFHTSFEDVAGAHVSDRAKTGEKVWSGSYSVPLTGIAPGEYALSYWQSNDLGLNWTKAVNRVTVDAGASQRTIGGSGWIDEVRLHPLDARIETCTYKPGVGVSSQTDHNGITSYYEYDNLGRQRKILDNDRKVVQEFEYHRAM